MQQHGEEQTFSAATHRDQASFRTEWDGMGWDLTVTYRGEHDLVVADCGREGYKEPTLVIKSTWHAAKEGTCAR